MFCSAVITVIVVTPLRCFSDLAPCFNTFGVSRWCFNTSIDAPRLGDHFGTLVVAGDLTVGEKSPVRVVAAVVNVGG